MNKCELRESGESYEPRKAMSISGAFLESACLAGDQRVVKECERVCFILHDST